MMWATSTPSSASRSETHGPLRSAMTSAGQRPRCPVTTIPARTRLTLTGTAAGSATRRRARLEQGVGRLRPAHRLRRGPAAAEHARQVGQRDQHLARLRALVAGDDPAALEHVDQAPGAGVADPQAALDHRDRGGLALDHEARRLVEQVVAVGIEVAVASPSSLDSSRRLEQLLRRSRARPDRTSAR